jgi:hypothetical protein
MGSRDSPKLRGEELLTQAKNIIAISFYHLRSYISSMSTPDVQMAKPKTRHMIRGVTHGLLCAGLDLYYNLKRSRILCLSAMI